MQNIYAKKDRSQPGFTIMEIIVVMAIIGIIFAILIPNITKYTTQAKAQAAKISLQKIQSQIETYFNTFGKYPSTLRDLVDRPADPAIGQRWTQLLEEKEIVDPWKHEYVYQAMPGQKPPYQLYSWGAGGEGAPENEWVNVWRLD